jgi:hypothetical protein
MFFFFFNLKPHIAIIGDIIDSKFIKNRLEIQKKLQDVLNDINIKYSSNIESQFMITLGDEFQGLLSSGENIIDIIESIQIKMFPVHIRFGIGIGKIETEINKIPLGADGSAYHHARNMINKIKNTEKKNKSSNSNIMLESDGDHMNLEILLNTILSLCTTITQKWTDRQREVAFDCILNGDNQREVATRLNISQSAVYKLLANSNYYSYRKAMDTVSQALKNIKVE